MATVTAKTLWSSKEKLKSHEKQKTREKERNKQTNKDDVCREFGRVNSTSQATSEKQIKIICASEQVGSRIKRARKPERSDVDKALLNP